MSDELWQRTLEVFHRVVEAGEDGGDGLLAAECGDDVELRRSVEQLLAGHRAAPTFLDHPETLDLPGLQDHRAGQQLGPYRLEALLGEGGMGAVYRATQQEPIERTVAIKLIQLGMATREVVARFESERQALALLDHPNIAKVFDAGASEQGHPYFVMELVEGVSITRYCDQKTLGIRQRLELAIQVCRAVHHAHQKGIIHRDLKPSNILVTEHDGMPVPKVIDFGVARAVDEGPSRGLTLTHHGRFLGTPEYMSPEQAEMVPDIDIRTDVYALGVVLYELLVGELPFETEALRSETPDRLGRWLRDSDARPPSTRVSGRGPEVHALAELRRTHPSALRSELRGDLDWIVLRALEKERDRRYGSASELAVDIERHLNHEPVLAGPPQLSYRMGKFVRRNRLAVSVATLVVLFLVVFAAVTSWQAAELRRALDRSERETRKAREVTELLTGLFDNANPSETRGNEISAREILERGSRRIRTELAGQPEIQGAMLTAIGEIYVHLGLFTEAEEVLLEGLEVQQEKLPSNHPGIAATHHILAFLLQWQDRLPEAEEHARKSLEVLEAGGQGDSSDWVEYRTLLGVVLRNAGKFEESEHELLRAIEVWPTVERSRDPKAIGPMTELSSTLRALGRFEEAEALLREYLEHYEHHLPEDHPDVATFKSNLGSLLADLDRNEEAEAWMREALATKVRIYGDEHVAVAIAMNNLARICQRVGKLDEALSLQREVLEMRRRLQGSEHSDVAVALANLGVTQRRIGNYAEAEALYRESLALNQRVLGADHPTVAIAHHNLAVLLHRMDRREEAEAEIRRAIDILRPALGEGHPNLARSEAALGKILVESGRFVEGEEVLRSALAVQVATLPAGHRRIHLTNVYIAQALLGQQRFAEAEAPLLDAYRFYVESRGAESESARDAAETLVELYEGWGRPEEAMPYRSSASGSASPSSGPM